VLRCENGGEYTSTDFILFCAREGVKKELNFPYNPKQNGVAEREKISIIRASSAMTHDQRIPLFLWVKAYNTVVYLQNRIPHRSLGNMTLEEAYTGKKPQVGHFRIFGCITFSHVPKERRTNMEPTTEKGIFVGYSETSKAHQIYIPA
jgi:hypothetical protein